MFCYRHKATQRLAQWETQIGETKVKAPIIFETRDAANDFKTKVMQGYAKDWKLKQIEKSYPCFIYEGDGHWRYEGYSPAKNIINKMNLYGPFRHEALSEADDALCRKLYQSLGKIIFTSYEQWEANFLRDQHPSDELELWASIDDAYHRYMASHPTSDPKQAILALISVCSGGKGEGLEEVASYYKGRVKPMIIEPCVRKYKIQPTVSRSARQLMPVERLAPLIRAEAENATQTKPYHRHTRVDVEGGTLILLWDWVELTVAVVTTQDLEDAGVTKADWDNAG